MNHNIESITINRGAHIDANEQSQDDSDIEDDD